jgi:hypothetical protein
VTPASDPLAGLRGYHLPEPVSWWPPAPGWWLLALLGLLAAGLAARWLARRHRRGAPARAALRELGALQTAYGRDGDAAAYARGLSRLLRRYALARFPRGQVAGLAGEDWLAFLDAHGGGGRFRRGAGRLLAEAPYRAVTALPADELARLARDWIDRNGGGGA